MSANLYRGPLTDHLLEALTVVGKPVGDGLRPPGAGWVGQPNAPGSKYIPFLVLSSSTSTRGNGPLGKPQSDWQINYLVSCYGVQRQQCDWMADKARDVLGDLRNTNVQLGPREYRIQQVWTQTIGGITPSNATDPPIWSQSDQLVIWLSEETT